MTRRVELAAYLTALVLLGAALSGRVWAVVGLGGLWLVGCGRTRSVSSTKGDSSFVSSRSEQP